TDAVRTVRVAGFPQLACSDSERCVPVDLDPLPTSGPLVADARSRQQVFAHPGPSQPILMVKELVPVTPLHAQRDPIHGGIWIRGYANDLVALHVQIELATDATIGASGGHNFVRTSQPVRHSVVERSSRTDRRTRTARFTSRFEHRRVISG